jgi:hypothetical protein
MKHVGLLSIVFVLGCVAGGVASQVAVLPARAGSDAPRWEYNCGVNASKEQLNEAGAQGWELVSVDVLATAGEVASDAVHATKVQFCFKRAR